MKIVKYQLLCYWKVNGAFITVNRQINFLLLLLFYLLLVSKDRKQMLISRRNQTFSHLYIRNRIMVDKLIILLNCIIWSLQTREKLFYRLSPVALCYYWQMHTFMHVGNLKHFLFYNFHQSLLYYPSNFVLICNETKN